MAMKRFASTVIILLMTVLSLSIVDSFAADSSVYIDENGIHWSYIINNSNGTESAEITGAENIPESGDITFPASIPNTATGESLVVRSIGSSAFSDNERIQSITICPGMTSVGDWAFYNCKSLKSITLPASINRLGAFAMYSCDSLESINVDEENKVYSSLDGMLFTKDKEELIMYPSGNTDSEYIVPNYVIRIGSYSFAHNKHIKSVTIPSSVDSIENYAFYCCSSLESVKLEKGIKTIKDNAFSICTSLKSVDLPDSLTTIDNRVFAQCTSLSEISFPDSITSFGNNMLESSGISTAVLPETLTAIPVQTFDNCYKLHHYSVPENIKSINNNAFSYCFNMKDIYIPAGVTSIGSDALSCCGEYQSDTGRRSFVICGLAGSYAEQYAKENNIDFCAMTRSEYDEKVAADEIITGDDPGTGGNDGPGNGGENGGNDQPTVVTPQTQSITIAKTKYSLTTNSKSFGLRASAKTALSYKSSNSKVVKVDRSGKVTVTGPGKAKITVKAAGSQAYHKASAVVTITVKLAKPGLKATKKGTKVKLTWTKSNCADGYKIYVKGPDDKRFICRVTKSAKVKSITHRGLIKGKTYRYKVVAFKKVKGKTVYSNYSPVKKVKIN